MKKFVVLTYGFVPPTDDVQRKWGEWFKSVGPRLVDPGSPFGRGVERPSPFVRDMPIIESVRVYEAYSM